MAERKGLGENFGVNSPQPKYDPTIIRDDGTRTVLDALKHHFDLYYLTHTPLEEMQPPTEEELKKLTEIEKLPIAPPIPSRSSQTAILF
ncbi:hypothetical protein [Desulfurobacterium atlanticum]|uniref:Uncharacterized protein n=1 Tax=Desulfurobacterium atlanticum TaxID=240169 RepID=A0A238YC38_9BACT|nr:hypothetical protein [Desulfurobacterium atlanticum]SNR68697.1 hypothetical protein SAMN06265340_10332 [Desulfurobacterium atlanticum]